ncbi:Eco29kI family restriction endonuclease [Sphingomonas parapaucimobilis]|uniref:Putative type II restriction enzyme n=1 Tax=Sphingomonas parapaucimobilis NBRC 15100 TaxID=1219049 RepID=A0A0A1W8D9_9SPHN|nr:Eco29kI family restriction endonuclease [Sphingomonas parapaucimobilis]GAM01593.1 putative type II restriction enzyme [Sphingomonas parapaucimobilis NBRC 15100]
MSDVYNPLDKINLGKSVAEALLEQPAMPLSGIAAFEGAGIYVLYYHGDYPAYAPIAAMNAAEAHWPIYIGKAIPSGGRKGASLSASSRGRSLYNRLSDHRDSIADVQRGSGTLSVQDFSVRYLIVDDIWIPLGESLLITRFRPVWNIALDGFGNHDPGKGRYNGLRPLWDHLHPGRGWAIRCAERTETLSEIATRISDYLDAHPLHLGSHR